MHPVCLTLDLREFMMPNIMNGLKAADEARVKRRQLLIAMAAAMVVGLAVSYYSAIKVSYAHGAPYTGGSWFMRQLEGLLTSPKTSTNWDEHGLYVIRKRVHDLFDVDASNLCMVAPAPSRLYDAEFVGNV